MALDSSIRVKICGLRRPEDACLATQLGAWALGFIFFEGSPRAVTPAAAANVVAEVKQRCGHTPLIVGVFVGADLATIVETTRTVPLDLVQLHGDEPPELVVQLPTAAIKAFRVAPGATDSAQFHGYEGAAFWLIDADVKGQYGGTGKTTDWALARRVAARHQVILSGGLTPLNALAAIAATKPYAIDLSSGVEAAPGIKAHDKLRALFSALTVADVLKSEGSDL